MFYRIKRYSFVCVSVYVCVSWTKAIANNRFGAVAMARWFLFRKLTGSKFNTQNGLSSPSVAALIARMWLCVALVAHY